MAKSKIKDSDVLAYLRERKQGLREELEKIETMLSVVGASSKSTIKKGKKEGKKKLAKAIKAIRKKVAQAIDGVKEQAGALADSIAPSVAADTEVKKPKANKKAAKSEALSAPAAKRERPAKKASEPEKTETPIAVQAPAKRTRKVAVVKPAVSVSASTEAAHVITKQAPVKKAVAPKGANEPAPVASKPVATKPPVAKKATGNAIPISFDPKAKMDDKIRYALAQKKETSKDDVIDFLNGLEPEYGLAKLKKVVAFRLNHLLKTGQVKARESKAGPHYSN